MDLELDLDRLGNLCVQVVKSHLVVKNDVPIVYHITSLEKVTDLPDEAVVGILDDFKKLNPFGFVRAMLPDGTSLGEKPIKWWVETLQGELEERGITPY